MQSTVKLKYLRIAPRKVRLVTDLIKGKRVSEAHRILDVLVRKAAPPIMKSLQSAIAGAQHNFEGKEENLYIEKVMVEEGPKLKRYRPRARGRAFPIEKKTSHITLVLHEVVPTETEQGKLVQTKKNVEVKEKTAQTDRPEKFRPERDVAKPKAGGGVKRMFRRKAIV
jgi:large subunit ribosomal protein L22